MIYQINTKLEHKNNKSTTLKTKPCFITKWKNLGKNAFRIKEEEFSFSVNGVCSEGHGKQDGSVSVNHIYCLLIKGIILEHFHHSTPNL